jgi:2-C-methyl-D-erythritol 4-phosphate cytidylyltransferase/2-C-methyl-D-erythritol 4-phosphate cytidylyltransferase/2-C-methyl-D-erythritol 2,4-cyclodiphosphate synthase
MGGTKKEYRPLPGAAGGLTVLGAAVSAFAAIPAVKTIVIAVPADPATGEAAARNALPPQLLAGKDGPALHFVPGGATRRASVFNALSFLAVQGLTGFALIHDGARPWVSPALIQRVIDGLKTYRAVIPLLPLTETPKETDLPLDAAHTGPVLIKRHLKRAVIGAAQTPQGFAFPEIFEAHRAAHQQAAAQDDPLRETFTDDAEVWAAFCGPVAAIPGEPENRKITFSEDLDIC